MPTRHIPFQTFFLRTGVNVCVGVCFCLFPRWLPSPNMRKQTPKMMGNLEDRVLGTLLAKFECLHHPVKLSADSQEVFDGCRFDRNVCVWVWQTSNWSCRQGLKCTEESLQSETNTGTSIRNATSHRLDFSIQHHIWLQHLFITESEMSENDHKLWRRGSKHQESGTKVFGEQEWWIYVSSNQI